MSTDPHRPARLRHRRLRGPPPARRRRSGDRARHGRAGRGRRGARARSGPARRRPRRAPHHRLRAAQRRPVDLGRRRGHGRHRADPRACARAPRGGQVGRLGQQAAPRPARRGAVRRRRGARRAAAVRGQRVRRHPRDQGAARVDDRERRPPDRRHRQRHDELHPEPDGADRHGLCRCAGRGAAARIRRGRPDRGRDGRRCGCQDRHPRVDRVSHPHPPGGGRLRRHRPARPGRRRAWRGARLSRPS